MNLLPPITIRIHRHYRVTSGAQQRHSVEMIRLIRWFTESLREQSEIDLILEINRSWRAPIDAVPGCRFHASLHDNVLTITRLDENSQEKATVHISRSYSYTHITSQFQLMLAEGVNPTEQGFLPAFIRFYIEFSHLYGKTRLYRLLETMREPAFHVNTLWPRLCGYDYFSVVRGED